MFCTNNHRFWVQRFVQRFSVVIAGRKLLAFGKAGMPGCLKAKKLESLQSDRR